MHYDTAETLLAVITAFSAKFVVGNAISFIQKQRPLLFPFLAHSRHSASYHRKSAHFSRNNGNRRIKVFGVMFRGDFQGKYGHRAALKCPIVYGRGRLHPADLSCLGSVLVSVLPGCPAVVPAPESHSGVSLPLVRSFRSGFLHIPAKSHGATSPGKHIPHRLVIRLE